MIYFKDLRIWLIVISNEIQKILIIFLLSLKYSSFKNITKLSWYSSK